MLKELPREEIKMTAIENKIIDKRLIGLSFCQLDDDSLKTSVDELILKASAITGCALPQTEFFADILTKEIVSYINEFGYGELTIDEIIFSLRLNAKGKLKWPSGVEIEQIKFSGNNFNIDFFANVLFNYFQLRDILDRKCQNFLDGH